MSNEGSMSTAKTLVVIVVVVSCFSVLYPRVFHPLILQIFGYNTPTRQTDDMADRIPPHLRKGPTHSQRSKHEDASTMARHMRHPGMHPGAHGASEMKSQYESSKRGHGGGIMTAVLPMYAVGIILYLIYTLTKVFSRKDPKEQEELANQYKDIHYNPDKQKFLCGDHDEEADDEGCDPDYREFRKRKARQANLERLLMKAEDSNITQQEVNGLKEQLYEMEGTISKLLKTSDMQDNVSTVPRTTAEREMRTLKNRLLETESQMNKILEAMEQVKDRVDASQTDSEILTAPETEEDWTLSSKTNDENAQNTDQDSFNSYQNLSEDITEAEDDEKNSSVGQEPSTVDPKTLTTETDCSVPHFESIDSKSENDIQDNIISSSRAGNHEHSDLRRRLNADSPDSGN